MPNLKFRRLLVISDTTESGNQFNLNSDLILVTANENSAGKSTLVKLPFWALGCDPAFDTNWKNQDCRVLLEFSIGEDIYEIHRYKDIIHFRKKGGKFIKFIKISGAYSEMLATLLGFKVQLPNQKTNILETPPPAYYFSAFYIDQKKSWSKAWDGFENLFQYKNWKDKVVRYHIGILPPEHFELEKTIFEIKSKKTTAEDLIKRLDISVEVVNSNLSDGFSSLDEEEFLRISENLKGELFDLVKNEEELLEKIASNEAEKSFLEQQGILSEEILREIDSDYRFATENLTDEVECPLCGTIHANSVVKRASILTDKQQAEDQLSGIKKALTTINNRLVEIKELLKTARGKIKEVKGKFGFNENFKGTESVNDILTVFGANRLKTKIEAQRNEQKILSGELDIEAEDKREEQRQLNKDLKKEINDKFIDNLSSLIRRLDVQGINLSEIENPMHYEKIVKEGGAAESTRAVFGYYVAIYMLIKEYGSEAIAPLAIDTPNQQEQSATNYEKIVDVILQNLSHGQIILCAMDNEKLTPYKNKAIVISLKKQDKLLEKGPYQEIKKVFEEIN